MQSQEDSRTSAWLIHRLKNLQDELAWRAFWERYSPKMRVWARQRGLAEDDADEIVAVVLDKLVRAMPTFEYDPEQRFRGWLRRVVENAVRDYWRAQTRRPGDRGSGDSDVLQQLQALEAPESGELIEELNSGLELQGQFEQQAVECARGRVEERSWNAFWLLAVEQRPGAEVAKELGMSVAAVHMARGRVGKILREELAALGVSAPEERT